MKRANISGTSLARMQVSGWERIGSISFAMTWIHNPPQNLCRNLDVYCYHVTHSCGVLFKLRYATSELLSPLRSVISNRQPLMDVIVLDGKTNEILSHRSPE